MLNLAFALMPKLGVLPGEADGGFLGKLALWVRARVGETIGYHRALHQLHQLDDRDRDDLDLARADFPALARRHATGAEPVSRRHG